MHKIQVQSGPQLAFYSVQAAAAYLGIGQTTIRLAVRDRELKHYRYGKSIRIKHEDLLKWVETKGKPALAEVIDINQSRMRGRHPSKKPETSRGRPPIWPPRTINDYRKLARRIEKKMLKEEQ